MPHRKNTKNLLSGRCCDADPDKRPDARTLYDDISKVIEKVKNDTSVDNPWNTIYHNNVKPLSRFEKESKYSSTLLPTGDLPKPRNSYNFSMSTDFSLPSSEIGLEGHEDKK